MTRILRSISVFLGDDEQENMMTDFALAQSKSEIEVIRIHYLYHSASMALTTQTSKLRKIDLRSSESR